MKILHALGLTMLVAAGCASVPKPTDEIANAQAALRGAQELGARDIPAAALALKLSEDQIASAQALAEDGDNEEARYMAVRATNDAELALALTRLHQAKAKAAQAPNILAPSDAATN